MADPKIDIARLKTVIFVGGNLADDLELDGILPCKNRIGGRTCLEHQRGRFLLSEMRQKKMCSRCLAVWKLRVVLEELDDLAETKRAPERSVNYG